jgi:hypothetical protein
MLGHGAAQQFGGGIGRELLPDRIGEEVPQQDMQAVLRARVRSETRFSRLSVSSLKISAWPSGPFSGWTEVSRSFRKAARAVKVASSPSFFRALPVESTRTREERAWAGRLPPSRPQLGATVPADVRCRPRPENRPAAFREAFGPPLCRARSPLRFAGKVCCPTNSPCSSISTRRRSSPCGDRRR